MKMSDTQKIIFFQDCSYIDLKRGRWYKGCSKDNKSTIVEKILEKGITLEEIKENYERIRKKYKEKSLTKLLKHK